MKSQILATVLTFIAATCARADELRELCPSRPGLDTPSCTVDPGHLLVEIGAVDWTNDSTGGTRYDEIDAGQTLLHLGVDDTTEVQLGWTAFGRVRNRDETGVTRQTGTGDVTVALRRGLAGPNGPVAIQPYVTLPVGGAAIGLGNYSAGVLLPINVPLGQSLTLQATPEVDWLPTARATRTISLTGVRSAWPSI